MTGLGALEDIDLRIGVGSTLALLRSRGHKQQQPKYDPEELSRLRGGFITKKQLPEAEVEAKARAQLRYVDPSGRALPKREAFENFSDDFYGMGSGKMKEEKRLRKIEAEKKREAQCTLDSSQATGMDKAMRATGRFVPLLSRQGIRF